MNILITGVHGFVGSNLVAVLKGKHTIYGLDIVSPFKDGVEKTFAWKELDILPTVDIVIHLAGKAHDTKNQAKAQDYFDINTELTKKIYDWYLNSTAAKFIFFSSVKAAADMVEDEILTEDVIPNPKGPYGESKIAAENYILSKAASSKQQAVIKESKENLLLSTTNYQLPTKKTYILRPCMIHGPGNKGNLNLLYQFVKKGIPYPLGAFENRRSFTSIDNLCFIMEQLIEKDIPTGIYNVSDDESLSTNELIALIAKTLGQSPRIWKLNKKMIQFAAGIGGVFHFPLNKERLQKLTENYVVSNKKLKNAIGIQKMPVHAEDGFVKTIKSFSSL